MITLFSARLRPTVQDQKQAQDQLCKPKTKTKGLALVVPLQGSYVHHGKPRSENRNFGQIWCWANDYIAAKSRPNARPSFVMQDQEQNRLCKTKTKTKDLAFLRTSCKTKISRP